MGKYQTAGKAQLEQHSQAQSNTCGGAVEEAIYGQVGDCPEWCRGEQRHHYEQLDERTDKQQYGQQQHQQGDNEGCDPLHPPMDALRDQQSCPHEHNCIQDEAVQQCEIGDTNSWRLGVRALLEVVNQVVNHLLTLGRIGNLLTELLVGLASESFWIKFSTYYGRASFHQHDNSDQRYGDKEERPTEVLHHWASLDPLPGSL